jgi:hypothetical protein
MLRPDSFTITFNLPPEIIREYYDGLAKVETARSLEILALSKPSKSNLSSILKSCKPMLSKFCETANTINPKIAIGVGIDDETLKDFYKNIKYLNDLLKDETTVTSKVESKSSTETKPDTTETTPATTETKTDTTETTPATTETKTDTTETTSQSSSKTQTKKSKDKKIKKPYYQDGDNVVVDLNSIASVFGENANGGNIGDMMKMFAPMMEGLMGNLNQQKQNGDNKQTTENKPTENKETTDIK